MGKTDSVLEICNCRNEIHKLWIAVESINSKLRVPVKESTFEHKLNQYKAKCATYEDKIKKMEEEKICLLESIRILSTESSAGSKVSTECAVNNKQESPGESITMDGNHERSTQSKRSKNNPNGTTQKNSTRSSKSRHSANYVISIEVLAANLRAHPAIVGLRFPGIPNPLPAVSLYADDTSVISVSDAATLAVFEVYNIFERGTGSKLNLGKCEGLWLGLWCNC